MYYEVPNTRDVKAEAPSKDEWSMEPFEDSRARSDREYAQYQPEESKEPGISADDLRKLESDAGVERIAPP